MKLYLGVTIGGVNRANDSGHRAYDDGLRDAARLERLLLLVLSHPIPR